MKRQTNRKIARSTTAVLSAMALLSVAAVLMASGCASKQGATPPARPGGGIAEYREVTTTAQKAVAAALEALATVSAQSNQCPPEVLTNFSAAVQRLQVESVQVRARSQAILARGDDYFEHWHQRMAEVPDPEVRALAEKNRPQLQQDFTEIKRLSQEGREAFQLFLAGLRKLRNGLENNPSSLTSVPAQDMLKSAKENGGRVEQSLAGIQRELGSMSSMITPKTSPPGKEG
jgi:hypothetical protein